MASAELIRYDQSDYDSGREDGEKDSFFPCAEPWEVNHLVKQLQAHYPDVEEDAVREAVSSVCHELRPPRLRKTFIEMVIAKIKSSDAP